MKNRRSYFRYTFKETIEAHLSIHTINGKVINSKYAPVYLEDISAGGARIITTLDFPSNEQIIFALSFELKAESLPNESLVFQRQGEIVWKLKKLDNSGSYIYGFEFRANEAEISELTKIINLLDSNGRNIYYT